MSGADERYFGGGEVIGVEAAAAEMGAAPSGVDVVPYDLFRYPIPSTLAFHSHVCLRRSSSPSS